MMAYLSSSDIKMIRYEGGKKMYNQVDGEILQIAGGLNDDTIVFDEVEIQEGKVDFRCSYKKDGNVFSDRIFYELSEKFAVGTNELAIALSTLCGQAFKKVVFDFSVDENIVN